MSREFLEKIFVPFERQNNSTISGIQGTGLGMTIVKGFVDAMGGTIDIISEENRGTEIIVRLCQRLAEPPESPEKSKNFSYSPELFAGKRILLVEDNSMNREIASAILEESGLIIDTAENGAIAVEKLSIMHRASMMPFLWTFRCRLWMVILPPEKSVLSKIRPSPVSRSSPFPPMPLMKTEKLPMKPE